MASGEVRTWTLVAHVASSVPDGTLITNTATASSDTNDTTPGNNSASQGTTISAVADLVTVKTGPATAYAGTDITYTITVTNNGPSDAVGPLNVPDTYPAGTVVDSYTQTSGPDYLSGLPAGQVIVFTLVVTVNHNHAAGTITNSVTATSSTTDPNLVNNTSTVDTVVSVATTDLVVSKSVLSSTAAAGSNIWYTVSVTNNGPSDYAANVDLADATPANTTFVQAFELTSTGATITSPAPGGTGTVHATLAQLNNGATLTIRVVVKVNTAVAAGTIISNTGSVTTATSDPNSGNDSASVNVTTTASADLSVTNTGPSVVAVNATIQYTDVVTNNGPSNATGIVLLFKVGRVSTLQSWSQFGGPAVSCAVLAGHSDTYRCTLATLAPGASFSLHFNVKTKGKNAATSTATVSASSPDPVAGNNSATKNTTH
jgi:uncharacterized repeat protein (TIGR01451 family)